MNKEWQKELQENRIVIWLCRLNQKKIRKSKEIGSTTKIEVATTIQLVEETNTKKTCRIKKDHTKATKEVVLLIEEEVVVENLTRVIFSVSIVRCMVTTLVIVHKNERIKKVVQSLQNMNNKI